MRWNPFERLLPFPFQFPVSFSKPYPLNPKSFSAIHNHRSTAIFTFVYPVLYGLA